MPRVVEQNIGAMRTIMKRIIGLVSSIIVLVLFAMWFASAGGYESLIGLIGAGIAVLLQVARIPSRSGEQWRTVSTTGKTPSDILRLCAGATQLAKPRFGEIHRKGV